LQNADDNPFRDAIDWHVRLATASASDWLAFLQWLENNPQNRKAYDRVVLADASLGEALDRQSPSPASKATKPQARSQFASRPKPRWRALGAVAAVAVALVSANLAYPVLFPPSADAAFESSPGQQRTLALADGSRIMMNGGTRVVLDRNDPRSARLERGEAAFQIVHDPANPFTLSVGQAHVQDVGTVFNVAMTHNGFDLAVAEGAVVFNPDADKIKLVRGATLHVSSDDGAITVGSADPHAIGAWRRGELVYHGATLADIAADLERSLGTKVSVSPEIAAHRFTGLIRIDHQQDALFQRLDGLFDTRSRRSANGWQIESA
jgi:transmembrane sensor